MHIYQRILKEILLLIHQKDNFSFLSLKINKMRYSIYNYMQNILMNIK